MLIGRPAGPRPATAVGDLTGRPPRQRRGYGQAALLIDQAGLAEKDPERAAQALYHAQGLKALGQKPHEPEVDNFGAAP